MTGNTKGTTYFLSAHIYLTMWYVSGTLTVYSITHGFAVYFTISRHMPIMEFLIFNYYQCVTTHNIWFMDRESFFGKGFFSYRSD